MNAVSIEPPERYHVDTLHLMARDAGSLFVYWEISNRRRWLSAQHFECDWHVLPKVLRVYDTTDIYFNGQNANSVQDIETTPEASSWYIHHLKPGNTYTVDYGTYTIYRQYVPLLRSNAVRLPRHAAPGYGEPIVAVAEEAYESGRYIRPAHFENFMSLAGIIRKGVHLGHEAFIDERAAHPYAPHASALYPPS